MDSQGKAKVALTFALYQGDQLVRRDTIAQDIVKVGKDPRSHLRVDDELASRMHAVIEVASPTDITLIDLGNEPGTLVNGQRVNKCKMRPGDQIQIGSTLIVLENAEAGRRLGWPGCASDAAAFVAGDVPMPAAFCAERSGVQSFCGRQSVLRERPPQRATRSPATNPFAAPPGGTCARHLSSHKRCPRLPQRGSASSRRWTRARAASRTR